MQIWLGGFDGQYNGGPWRLYLSLNDLSDPGPSRTLLFWYQREDSINTGNFLIDMSGFPDKPALTKFSGDFPASYHNRAGGLSFTDGHVEIKRWLDPRTTPPLLKNSTGLFAGGPVSSPNNQDIIWLQERSTRKIKE